MNKEIEQCALYLVQDTKSGDTPPMNNQGGKKSAEEIPQIRYVIRNGLRKALQENEKQQARLDSASKIRIHQNYNGRDFHA